MLRYPEQHGFVLLVVLIFMQMLFLLNGCLLESVLLLTKVNRKMALHEDYYHQAERILSIEETSAIFNLPHCLIAFTSPEVFTEKPLSWWEMQGCSGNFQSLQYYYVVESLGTDSCAVVSRAQQTVAAWFRMTLFLYSAKSEARIFLQSTFLRPGISGELCVGRQYVVLAGRQSFRELN